MPLRINLLCVCVHVCIYFFSFAGFSWCQKWDGTMESEIRKICKKRNFVFQSLSTKDYPEAEGNFIIEMCLKVLHIMCPFFCNSPLEKRELSLFGRLVFKTDTVNIQVLFYLHLKSQGDSGKQ